MGSVRSDPNPVSPAAPARILLAEDEGIVALDLATTLADLHYDVVASVSSGEAAIEKAVKLLPNLVLMDILLSGKIDGILRQFKASAPHVMMRPL